ncbi:hypothetical protein, partial [Mesorhizobium sp. M2D.F.Ca.ET.233.01.1.1]|uniref:hypothetical protein n=1 Tax=Mesorhizobium sp. M2D.F.Ca.ET.233.01.1.1 TaxID=2563943 RepID=UPI001AEDC35F
YQSDYCGVGHDPDCVFDVSAARARVAAWPKCGARSEGITANQKMSRTSLTQSDNQQLFASF